MMKWDELLSSVKDACEIAGEKEPASTGGYLKLLEGFEVLLNEVGVSNFSEDEKNTFRRMLVRYDGTKGTYEERVGTLEKNIFDARQIVKDDEYITTLSDIVGLVINLKIAVSHASAESADKALVPIQTLLEELAGSTQ